MFDELDPQGFGAMNVSLLGVASLALFYETLLLANRADFFLGRDRARRPSGPLPRHRVTVSTREGSEGIHLGLVFDEIWESIHVTHEHRHNRHIVRGTRTRPVPLMSRGPSRALFGAIERCLRSSIGHDRGS